MDFFLTLHCLMQIIANHCHANYIILIENHILLFFTSTFSEIIKSNKYETVRVDKSSSLLLLIFICSSKFICIKYIHIKVHID